MANFWFSPIIKWWWMQFRIVWTNWKCLLCASMARLRMICVTNWWECFKKSHDIGLLYCRWKRVMLASRWLPPIWLFLPSLIGIQVWVHLNSLVQNKNKLFICYSCRHWRRQRPVPIALVNRIQSPVGIYWLLVLLTISFGLCWRRNRILWTKPAYSARISQMRRTVLPTLW